MEAPWRQPSQKPPQISLVIGSKHAKLLQCIYSIFCFKIEDEAWAHASPEKIWISRNMTLRQHGKHCNMFQNNYIRSGVLALHRITHWNWRLCLSFPPRQVLTNPTFLFSSAPTCSLQTGHHCTDGRASSRLAAASHGAKNSSNTNVTEPTTTKEQSHFAAQRPQPPQASNRNQQWMGELLPNSQIIFFSRLDWTNCPARHKRRAIRCINVS